MSKILFNMLAFVIKRLIDANLFDHIKDACLAQLDNDLTGEQKRAAVKQELYELTGELSESFKKTAPNIINLAIETAVTLIKK